MPEVGGEVVKVVARVWRFLLYFGFFLIQFYSIYQMVTMVCGVGVGGLWCVCNGVGYGVCVVVAAMVCVMC